LTLPIQDWAEYVAVGERYHISAILGRLIVKKNVVYDHGVPTAVGVAASALHSLRLYTIVCGDVDLLVQAFYDNGHISS
jgi:hypothetical protein